MRIENLSLSILNSQFSTLIFIKMKLYVQTKKMLADMQTPVSIYLKIRDLYTNSVLLESSDYHGIENSYSYIGFNQIGGISVNRFLIREEYPDGQKIETPVTDKMTVANRFDVFLKSFELKNNTSANSLINGLLGYTSYESVQYFEDINYQPAKPCLVQCRDCIMRFLNISSR